MNQRRLSKKQEQKILNILLDLYNETKDEYVLLNHAMIRSKYNLGSYYCQGILDNMFDIKKINGNIGRGTYAYKWKTIRPNIYMSREICKYSRGLINKKNNSDFKIARENELTLFNNIKGNKEEVKKDTHREENKTISILWGLVKININK
jgi:hypothetical protein